MWLPHPRRSLSLPAVVPKGFIEGRYSFSEVAHIIGLKTEGTTLQRLGRVTQLDKVGGHLSPKKGHLHYLSPTTAPFLKLEEKFT